MEKITICPPAYAEGYVNKTETWQDLELIAKAMITEKKLFRENKGDIFERKTV